MYGTLSGARLSGSLRERGFRSLARRALQRAFRIPLTLAAAGLLRLRLRHVHSIDEALDLAYTFSFGGVDFAPWQERSEISAFLREVQRARPQAILEIGTSNGGSLFLLTRAAAPDAVVVSIDLPHGAFGGGYPLWRAPLYRAFATGRQRVRLLRADSHAASTREQARAALGGRLVDVLFIDGDHTYAGVKHDFETYGSIVRSGGVVALHDIVPPNPNGPKPRGDYDLQGGDVSDLWEELRTTQPVMEFVDDWRSGRFGIGALRTE